MYYLNYLDYLKSLSSVKRYPTIKDMAGINRN